MNRIEGKMENPAASDYNLNAKMMAFKRNGAKNSQ